MIPALLHNRLLVAGGAGGVIAAPAYQTVLAYATGTSSAAATAGFSVNPDGTWTADGTAYVPQSGSWYAPTTPAVGVGFEVRITPTNTSGSAGALTNEAVGWAALNAPRRVQVVAQRFTEGSTVSGYSMLVEVRPTGGAVVSSGVFSLKATADVAAAGGGGGGCPALGMWLASALTVGEAEIGQIIDSVAVYDPPVVERLAIIGYEVSMQPCYRLCTAGGAAYLGSDTTPFTLRDGSSLFIADMLGQQVLRDDGAGGLVWDEVTSCYPVGDQLCAKVGVGGHSLLCGENPLMRIVSHNTMKF